MPVHARTDREPPQPASLAARFVYEGPAHDEALARLHFLVEQHRRLGLLLGETGTGKTLILEIFARELRRAGHTAACVDCLGISWRELLWQIAAQWGLNPSPRDDEFRLWRHVFDRIVSDRMQKRESVLLLDNAEECDDSVHRQLVRVAQCDPTPDSRLTLVLAAHPDVVHRLGQRLLELAALRIDLGPWDEVDISSYLHGLVAQSGRKLPTFAPQALVRLHSLTAGVPRRVTQLADLALLAGSGQGLASIDAATLESVCAELGAVQLPGTNG